MNYKDQSSALNRFGLTRSIVVLAILALIGSLLLTGHISHVLGLLPYLLLLACPFMHFFMHRRGGRDGKDGHGSRGCH